MKKYFLLLSIGTMISVNLAFAKPVVLPSERSLTAKDLPDSLAALTNTLPRFDLDFPGGTPDKLVKAIEKATDKPLNAIIPVEDADVQLPPISVKDVTVPQLFEALELSSDKLENQITGSFDPATGKYNTYGGAGTQYVYQPTHFKYGFRTYGVPTEKSIWYFHQDTVLPPPQQFSPPPNICRFYQLSSYLDEGYKVEDITTAIETGWKMLGETNLPKLSYHKDTKLLIAVGEPNDLALIDGALQQLGKPESKSASIPEPPNSPNPEKSKVQ